MNPIAKSLVKDLAPPLLVRWLKRLRGRSGYQGDFRCWADARAASSGYDSPAILEKAANAARMVREGRAAWERDSVLFAEPVAHWPVLSCLLRSAAASEGKLRVIDFGGAFGSLLSQHRAWLDGIDVTWTVVEQSHFVALGEREFAHGPLRFRSKIEDALPSDVPATLLLSSVLPYLEGPHWWLERFCGMAEVGTVVIDRTGFVTDSAKDRLTVQHVPLEVYDASYPCWFLSQIGFLRHFEPGFVRLAEWKNTDAVNIAAEFRGMLWERRQS